MSLSEPELKSFSRPTDIKETYLQDVKKLNVIVISDAAPSRNGVGTFYVDLLEHLNQLVNSAEIISPIIENGKWKAGLVFPLPGDSTQKLCMPNPVRMYRHLKRINPDLIIIATPGVYGVVGSFLAKRLKIPTLVGFHTSFEEITELYWSDSLKGKIVSGWFKFSNQFLFNRCQAVMANSDPMIERAKALGAQTVISIPTLISPIFTSHPIKSSPEKCNRILFAGRLAPEKNLNSVIKAAEEMPDAYFSIAGEGPEREKVEKASEQLENLNYLGWLERSALRAAIDDHDVLILPSFFESFGTIILEAMARKRLVLVSAQCGIANSKEYISGLYTMRSRNLTECLSDICNAETRERIEKAKRAHQLTTQLNKKNIHHWCQIFLETVNTDSEEISKI